MKTVRVNTSTPYDILIERGLIAKTGELVKGVSNAKKVCVITDSNVGADKGHQKVTIVTIAFACICTYIYSQEAEHE